MNDYQDAVIRLQAIFDDAVDGIIIIDSRGIIEEVNKSACVLFGYNEDELVKKSINMLMPQKEAVRHDGYLHNYQQSRIPKIIGIGREVTGKRKSGEEFPFWLAVNEVRLNDRTIYTGFIHDLSEIKNAERRLQMLNEELEKKVIARTYELENVVNQLLALNKQLEEEINIKIKIQQQLKDREAELEKSLLLERELGELKSRFVSMASHEFRTPLSTVLSSVSLIGRYTESDQQANREKHINRVKSTVAHLTAILNDFLSMNKLEEGRIQTFFEDFDPIELFHEVIEEMKTILKPNQQLINLHSTNGMLVRSDRKIIKNTLINLISNAIKYSKEDGKINCNISVNEKVLDFSVSDEGIGIPDEDQKHLFDRFFRASNVTNIEGTGLGLNIVKKYLEMLDGEISFVSKLYIGTTFNVSIPNKINS
ncbi:MAG: PAS domain S-box protein [Saprospiraceae bacterium]|nr:PAS domain S-box protein [Saprospiraceae bacterium]MBK8825570.1 PAS domain S-box protein [Saprospiraceae bacterium]MBP6539297.1 PAS domain S-box protein [Saprospiraceae bacterium]MBP8212311.1 PAS domain S-box protein [Saprospiraceae bacterium]HQV66486.1 PAS domain-containing sensor histidine kinase [Saprospiraceae bacterium]